MTWIKTKTALLIFALTAASCNPKTKFTALPSELPPVADFDDEARLEFKIESSTQNFEQIELDKNFSYVGFQVRKTDGSFLTDLKPVDFTIYENDKPFNNYKFTKNSYEYTQIVDIVFTVDVTGSMSSTIESAKARLINFVYKSREAGYHTRMCLVTFGDYTLKKCDRFYDNNPKDPTTWTQVEELISEISKLKAIVGSQDPGGSDFNENPMRALMDAALAPWLPNHQRFAILVTDDGFLYSPNNSGSVGALAPDYSEVKRALQASKMKVFAATPSLAGYNKKFGRDAGVVELSNGEWFKFSDLVSGKITLDSILNRILVNLNTTFVVEYTVEEQVGLNPALPVEKRNLKVVLKDGTLGEIYNLNLKSNLPDGRKEYPKEFKLGDKEINKQSIQVELNQIPYKDYELKNKSILVFKQAPAAKTKIKVIYELENPKDSIRLQPIKLPLETIVEKLDVKLNDIYADPKYFTVADVEGRYKVLNLSDSVFDAQDTFKVKALRKLDVKVRVKSKSQ